jgi:protein TonB
MRILSGIVCVLAVALGIAAAQSGTRQVPLRYDPPAVLSTVDAVYPVQSVASGTVVLEVSLDDNGKIAEVKVVRGIASLTEPAEHSVRQWKFQPAKLDGKPVPSKIVAAFSFVPPNVGPRV